MPCFDPQEAADDKHNSHLAGAVCELFRVLSEAERNDLLARSPKLRDWWAEHELRDRDYRAYMDKMFRRT